LLAAVVGAQVLLLAYQIRRTHNVRLIRLWTVETIAPAQQAGTVAIDWLLGAWTGYFDLHDARAKNRYLQEQVDQLRLQVIQLQSRAAAADRLGALLAFRQDHADWSLLAAQVISANPSASTRVLYINRGMRNGVSEDMGVITPEGVVGKIVEAYPQSAQVLLITDRESGVGALLADSRTQGVAKGTGGKDLVMDYVVNDQKVAPGEQVLTSGLDQIFPQDLPVGAVVSTRPGSPFEKITVRTAARMDRLEDVLVILRGAKTPANPASAGDRGSKSNP
jgi:rod shape-determining protein MreC